MTDPTPHRPDGESEGDTTDDALPPGAADGPPAGGADPAVEAPADDGDDASSGTDTGDTTDTGEPDDDDDTEADDDTTSGGSDGPIRPEVVGRSGRGGGFMARMVAAQADANAARAARRAPAGDGGGDDPPTTEPTTGGRKVGRIVRIGCTVLVLIGALGAFSGISLLTDVDGAVCNNARAILDDEDDSLTGDEIDDLECGAAIERAESLDDAPDVATEGQARFQGALLVGTGVFQVAAGMVLQRRPLRRNRTIALVATALGVLIPVIGTISLVLALFVAYAIGFSGDSRAIFGLGRGFGGRRRPDTPPPEPPPEKAD